MVAGFDLASIMNVTIADILGFAIPLVLYTDSKSLYDALSTINPTTEKRLLIDLQVLRQSYERREITEIAWIPTEQNPADGMTKEKPNTALEGMIDNNKLTVTPNAWLERTPKTKKVTIKD